MAEKIIGNLASTGEKVVYEEKELKQNIIDLVDQEIVQRMVKNKTATGVILCTMGVISMFSQFYAIITGLCLGAAGVFLIVKNTTKK